MKTIGAPGGPKRNQVDYDLLHLAQMSFLLVASGYSLKLADFNPTDIKFLGLKNCRDVTGG